MTPLNSNPTSREENPCPARSFVLNSIMHRHESIPTRASLLQRLKDLDDQSSWNEFYELYHDLIFSVARREMRRSWSSGLTDDR